MPSMRMRAPELATARTVMLLGGAAFLVLPAAAFVGVMPADAWIRGALFDGATPGTYSYVPSMSVVEAITVAGGFTGLAAKNDTTITRSELGKKTIVRVPVADIGEGKAPNVYLRPGDIISIPERIF